jgi:hypothetical protein
MYRLLNFTILNKDKKNKITKIIFKHSLLFNNDFCYLSVAIQNIIQREFSKIHVLFSTYIQ